jgi:hypothetical protein
MTPRTPRTQHRRPISINERRLASGVALNQRALEIAAEQKNCSKTPTTIRLQRLPAPTARAAEVFGLAATPGMVEPQSTPSREALQELFLRASARRAERRRFVDTLRKILEQRLLAQPLLLLIPDRRRVNREV